MNLVISAAGAVYLTAHDYDVFKNFEASCLKLAYFNGIWNSFQNDPGILRRIQITLPILRFVLSFSEVTVWRYKL